MVASASCVPSTQAEALRRAADKNGWRSPREKRGFDARGGGGRGGQRLESLRLEAAAQTSIPPSR